MKKYITSICLFSAAMFLFLFIACQKQQPVGAQDDSPFPPSYTVNGLGINGVKPDGSAQSSTCDTIKYLTVHAYSPDYWVGADSTNQTGCALVPMWTSGGGKCIALFINDTLYKEPYTQYGLWSAAINSIPVGYTLLKAGDIYKFMVRTYCFFDTTTSPRYDSPTVAFVIPSGLPCEVPPIAPPPKSHKK